MSTITPAAASSTTDSPSTAATTTVAWYIRTTMLPYAWSRQLYERKPKPG